MNISFSELLIFNEWIYALLYGSAFLFFLLSLFLKRVRYILLIIASLMSVVSLIYGLINGLALIEGALEYSLFLIVLLVIPLLDMHLEKQKEQKE